MCGILFLPVICTFIDTQGLNTCTVDVRKLQHKAHNGWLRLVQCASLLEAAPVCCCTIKDTVLDVRHTAPRLHVQARQIGMGAVAARAHRLCLCAYRKQGVCLCLFFSRYSREEYSQTGSAVKVREVRSTQGSFGWQIPY